MFVYLLYTTGDEQFFVAEQPKINSRLMPAMSGLRQLPPKVLLSDVIFISYSNNDVCML